MEQERRILLGRVIGAFGVQGELKVQSFADPPEGLMAYQPWLLVHRGEEREVSGARGRVTAKGLTVRLADTTDRDAAEALAGAEIWVPRSRLPAPKPGEYYWVDLEGLAVSTVEGVELGTVSHLFNNGANDVVVVSGERERLIPFVNGPFVKSVDFDARRIVVDWDPDF